MSPPDGLRLVTYADLASAWQVSPRTVQRWIDAYEATGRRIRHRVKARIRGTNTTRVMLRVQDAEAVLVPHLETLSRAF